MNLLNLYNWFLKQNTILKIIIIIIIIYLCGPVLTNLIVLWQLPKWFQSWMPVAGTNADTWIGYFGNFSGGILGGLVVLLGLKITFDHERKKDLDEVMRF